MAKPQVFVTRIIPQAGLDMVAVSENPLDQVWPERPAAPGMAITANCAEEAPAGTVTDGGTVSNNTIDNNIASGGRDAIGGGIYGNFNTLQQNTLMGNSANRGGGAYFNGAATLQAAAAALA